MVKRTKKAVSKQQDVRKKKKATHKAFRLSRGVRVNKEVLSGRKLFIQAIRTLILRWKLFGGIVLVYGILYLVLVQTDGLSLDLDSLKEGLGGEGGLLENLFTSGGIFLVLLASGSTSADDVAGVYQTILFVIVGLALIWALRQVYGRNDKQFKIRIRDCFYKGMTPLIPVTLLMLIGLLQLLPAIFGANIYSIIRDLGLTSTSIEQAIWLIFAMLMLLLSIYWVVPTILAIYLATLPNMTPIKALRTAKNLVENRRSLVVRRLIVLPIFILLLAALIFIPAIAWLDFLVPYLYFALSMSGIVIIHAYLYELYRELIKKQI